MADVKIPKRQQSNNANLLTLAGMGVGAAYGGAPGAALGGQIGGAVGAQQAAGESQGVEPVGPIQRRMAQIDNSPLRQIRESIDSLKYVQDEQQRMELAKPLLQADYMARKG